MKHICGKISKKVSAVLGVEKDWITTSGDGTSGGATLECPEWGRHFYDASEFRSGFYSGSSFIWVEAEEDAVCFFSLELSCDRVLEEATSFIESNHEVIRKRGGDKALCDPKELS